ncbi:daptide-type RiPP biosynthesis methyltransferase [Parafrankia sp. FMc2]|uniref:daptide-type RiPP biosynthesis methyltransferase n=1 Tax=Parafrankia sp. FMc2 TaxID=3233196 RepID=UPI0034D75FEB
MSAAATALTTPHPAASPAAATGLSAAAADRPGTAGALLRMFGGALPVEDIYSEQGSVLYDVIGGGDQHEVTELLAVLGGARRSVLELAAGAGRLTLPLLADGHDVVALEKSPMMLRLLAAKAEPAGHLHLADGQVRRDGGPARLTLVEGDMTRLDLGRRFDAVVLGATSVSLLDEAGRAAMFAAVREHLAPAGVFLFSTLQMRRGPMLAQPVRENIHVLTVPGGPDGPDGSDGRGGSDGLGGSLITLIEWVDGTARQRLISALRATVAPSGAVEHRLFTSRVRILETADLERELAAAGLTAVARQQVTGGQEPDRSTVLLRCVRAEDHEGERR